MIRAARLSWPAWLLIALLAVVYLVGSYQEGRGASIAFTVPTKDVAGGPAGVRRVNAWFINCQPGHPRYNSWLLTWGARGADGQAMQMRVTPYVCAPGDSCGARVSCADGAGNWARDTTIYFRVKP